MYPEKQKLLFFLFVRSCGKRGLEILPRTTITTVVYTQPKMLQHDRYFLKH